jgi:hypothetical protein
MFTPSVFLPCFEYLHKLLYTLVNMENCPPEPSKNSPIALLLQPHRLPHLLDFLPQAGKRELRFDSSRGRPRPGKGAWLVSPASRDCCIHRYNVFPLTPESAAAWRTGFSCFCAGAAASALNSFGYTRRSWSFVPVFSSPYWYISRVSLCPPDGVKDVSETSQRTAETADTVNILETLETGANAI